MNSIKLQENESALLWKQEAKDWHSFEVWIKMIGNSRKFKGEILNPSDEDFGVWAWSFSTLECAQKCFDEITSGVRKITPMVEIYG